MAVVEVMVVVVEVMMAVVEVMAVEVVVVEVMAVEVVVVAAVKNSLRSHNAKLRLPNITSTFMPLPLKAAFPTQCVSTVWLPSICIPHFTHMLPADQDLSPSHSKPKNILTRWLIFFPILKFHKQLL